VGYPPVAFSIKDRVREVARHRRLEWSAPSRTIASAGEGGTMVGCRAPRTTVIRPTWIETFEELHPADAEVTAALLCTDHRWARASHRLIHHVCDSGLLSVPQLDELADWFLLKSLEIEVMISSDSHVTGSSASHRATEDVAADGPGSIVRRPIWPPLRRWAARHRVQRSPMRWRQVFALPETLPSRGGAAVAAGVMDAALHVPAADQPTAASLGLASGSGVVRLAALPAYATLEGVDVALARARSDPSATVRAWTPRIAGDPSAPLNAPRSAAQTVKEDARDQLSLF
jgi:hypothetical protein